MQMGGIMGGFYRISEWIWRFFYINILWLVFLIPGLIVFGFFPSTAAMFAVMRKWVRGEPDIPVFKTFWASYKKEFIKSNLLGLIIVLIVYVLYIDFQFIKSSPSDFVRFFHLPLVSVLFIFGLVLMYLFPVFVHYDVRLFQVFKNSFFIMIMFPFVTIMMGVACFAVYFIMMKIPGLIPVFGVSIYAYAISWGANLAFTKLELREEESKEKMESEELGKNEA
ncbi:YesL family protein [Bacillus sp. FJAT-50079]|uniref:YesL family protein n=1 Tax=Bacillus sp. FJAT-50079 TaxID=2833577 RepID=UPI001BCA4255|nr:YesL family protein [Bacillus sp. FJAT-50079]MBS4207827.1 YesL family protein [Bacillus sp. FJAT-50079]